MDIILASSSPRRKDLLKKIYNNFRIIPADVDESMNDSLSIYENITDVSLRKARKIQETNQDSLILAFDTVVYKNGKVYLKPVDRFDAHCILTELMGTPHEVITGCALIYNNKIHTFYDISYVHFNTMSDEWIYNYIDTMKPFDKSGSYGIQELGSDIINNIEGDIDNIIGIPVIKLKTELNKFLM